MYSDDAAQLGRAVVPLTLEDQEAEAAAALTPAGGLELEKEDI